MRTRRRIYNAVDNPEPTFVFSYLPLELQWKVWEYFCPHLTASSPLVLPFGLDPTGRTVLPDKHDSLAAATATARTVLSTHAASRSLALRALPHAITFKRAGGGGGTVRLNSDRDLILLLPAFPRGRTREDNCAWRVPGFSEHVVNLATDFEPVDFAGFVDLPIDGTRVINALCFYGCFPNLRAVYPPSEAGGYGEEDLRLCGGEGSVHRATARVEWGDELVDARLEWPDVAGRRGLAGGHDMAADQLPAGIDVVEWSMRRYREGLENENVRHWQREGFLEPLRRVRVWPLILSGEPVGPVGRGRRVGGGGRRVLN